MTRSAFLRPLVRQPNQAAAERAFILCLTLKVWSLADVDVVRQISEGTYDRQHAATELSDLVTAYEARIAGRSRTS